ncbi:MAG: YD repeat-containing protein [Paraburkholderia fungorum]|nr:YD repeat-containing protein [Paraburkholderia fungorum]
MSIPIERHPKASVATVRGVVATALVAGTALLPFLCHADDITYGYDALGRLTSVTVSGATAYYDYDAAGNITAIRRQGGVASAVPVSGTGSPPAAEAGNPALSPIPIQSSARQVRRA